MYPVEPYPSHRSKERNPLLISAVSPCYDESPARMSRGRRRGRDDDGEASRGRWWRRR
uniref:Uncharacterized protein n=1 Tax=Arundo donax TaxID=35708 RepID=A0A0A9D2W4_ARUDO